MCINQQMEHTITPLFFNNKFWSLQKSTYMRGTCLLNSHDLLATERHKMFYNLHSFTNLNLTLQLHNDAARRKSLILTHVVYLCPLKDIVDNFGS